MRRSSVPEMASLQARVLRASLCTVAVFLLGIPRMSGCLALNPVNITYDGRTLLFDGHRRLLVSAGIHYARSTPTMWPFLLKKAKAGGADMIQTYVFWNRHEPSPRQYYFEERFDLVRFLKNCADEGLYVNLRIGPYACAEWNFGGFPVWLREIPGIEFRTNNEPFKIEMERFVRYIVKLMKKHSLFAPQGGPIILAQVENEYGNIMGAFGEGGREYVKWAGKMALSLNTQVPWIMCSQPDAPGPVINTCNGFYCDGFYPNSADKPPLWTEDWNGWFLGWGGLRPHRPVADNAFAVARWFARGGSFTNYYMYHGGTNFDRVAGGPFIATTYDYDAPIDEYGLIRQPKYGHLADLHSSIRECEEAIVEAKEGTTYFPLGPMQEAHVYESAHGKACAAFLSNVDVQANYTVRFRGKDYNLPPWSVSVLPDCETEAYNTAKIRVQTTVMGWQPAGAASYTYNEPRITTRVEDDRAGDLAASDGSPGGDHLQARQLTWHIANDSWQWHSEPVGTWGETVSSSAPQEQISLTHDTTDYLWYSTRLDVNLNISAPTSASLVITRTRDAVHAFVNGQLAGSSLGGVVTLPVLLQPTNNTLSLLSMTVGLQNYGAWLEREKAGITGEVLLEGLEAGPVDITKFTWTHQVGLKGESTALFTSAGAAEARWHSDMHPAVGRPLTWFKAEFETPEGNDPVALNLDSMGKGVVWVNGHSLGRYWPSLRAPEKGCDLPCDYAGPYSPTSKCFDGCGEPAQSWYHVPREWLEEDGNLLVLFEELGGDPHAIGIATRAPHTVCVHVSDDTPAQLECGEGQTITEIEYASYGTPSGTCGAFQLGSCHVAACLDLVREECVGKRRCRVEGPAISLENGDPCPGAKKSLAIQASCRGTTGGATSERAATKLFSKHATRKEWYGQTSMSHLRSYRSIHQPNVGAYIV